MRLAAEIEERIERERRWQKARSRVEDGYVVWRERAPWRWMPKMLRPYLFKWLWDQPPGSNE